MMVSLDIPDRQLIGALPVRAAQYVRMSTEHQKYSPLNQQEAIRAYAERRGIEIVHTYADEGRSGLRFDGRPALRQLIQDVVSGGADFSLILVYDVSRWGRFQDADESAHYEFLCRQAGIQIRYCAEPFENDGSPLSSLIKGMKRLMAAEYSRELSVKVFEGHRRLVVQGYRQGSAPGLGMRRLLIDRNGVPKCVMEPGQYKNLQTDHTILVPGPRDEVALVRQMFRACAGGRSINAIAGDLNARGLRTPRGKLWRQPYVWSILHNEKYIGNNVWNKVSVKLKGKAVQNPPHLWIRADGAFKPIVSRKLFNTVQDVLARRTLPRPEEELLEGLQRLLAEKGHLSKTVIAADRRIPSPSNYDVRFGGLLNAYARIGYAPNRDWGSLKTDLALRELRLGIATAIAERVRESGKAASVRPDKRSMVTGDGTVVQIVILRCRRRPTGRFQWVLRPASKSTADIMLIVRMKPGNRDILDYYVFPRKMLRMTLARMSERNGPPLDTYRCRTLEPLHALLARTDLQERPMVECVLAAIASPKV